MSAVDYLTEDSLLPQNQKFVCISFLSDNEKKTTLSGIKIRGVYNTYDEACEQAKKIQSIDQYFNVFVGEMGKWLPFDPNPDSEVVKDSQYANEQLNNMMKSYMENQEKAKVYHEQRKQEMVRQNVMDNLKTRQESLEDLQTKLKKATKHSKVEEVCSIEQNIKSIEDQINKMEEKKVELDSQIDLLSTQVKSFGSTQGFGNSPQIVNYDI